MQICVLKRRLPCSMPGQKRHMRRNWGNSPVGQNVHTCTRARKAAHAQLFDRQQSPQRRGTFCKVAKGGAKKRHLRMTFVSKTPIGALTCAQAASKMYPPRNYFRQPPASEPETPSGAAGVSHATHRATDIGPAVSRKDSHSDPEAGGHTGRPSCCTAGAERQDGGWRGKSGAVELAESRLTPSPLD
jgi:hypothetical protein